MLLALALLHFQLDGRPAHIRPHPALRRLAGPSAGKFTMPHLQYFGGQILGHVKIAAVYWPDSAGWFATSDGQNFISQTDHFYAALVASSMFDWLSEYGTPSQTLGPGSFLGGTLITPQNGAQTLSEPDIEAELAAQVAAGHLPAPDADTLYQLHFAPGLTLRDGTDVACQAYCAYHDSFQSSGAKYFFSVIPNHEPPSACSSCGESSSWYANMTASASHEAIEAITDPDVGTVNAACGPAWCDPANPDFASEHAEIGDICEDDWSTGNGATSHTLTEWTIPDPPNLPWTVQREWSNASAACLTTAPDAFKLTLNPATIHYTAAGTYDVTMSTTAPSIAASATLGLFTLPSGVSATFSPQSVAAGSSGTLHLKIGAGVAPFQLMAFANSGPTLAYALAPAGDDFTLAAATTSLSLRAGSSAQLTIDTTTAAGSDSQTLTLKGGSNPPGVTVAPQTVTSGSRATLTVSAAPGTPSSSGSLTISATNGIRTRTASASLALDGDDFSATPPAQVSLATGGTSRFQIATATTHGAPQPLTATLVNPPAGVTASAASAQSGAPIDLSVTLSGDVQEGALPLTLQVAGPVASQTLTISAAAHHTGCSSAGGALPWLGCVGLFALRRRLSSHRPRAAL